MSHSRIPDDERVLAGAGMLLVAFAYVTSNHYLQIRWNTAVAVPVLWGPIGLAAGLAGVPLLFAGAGLAAGRAPHRSWSALLGRFVLPCLLLHVLAVAGTAWVLRRFASSFAPVALHDVAEIRAALLLPPPALAIPYTLALVAIAAHLSRTLPAPAVLAAATVGAVAGAWQGAAFLPAALLYFLIGQRLLTDARLAALRFSPLRPSGPRFPATLPRPRRAGRDSGSERDGAAGGTVPPAARRRAGGAAPGGTVGVVPGGAEVLPGGAEVVRGSAGVMRDGVGVVLGGVAVAVGGAVVAGAAVVIGGRPVTPFVALLTGLAALPPGVLLAGVVRSWRPAGQALRAVGALVILAGAVLVPATAVLVPATAVLDHVALPRVSLTAGTAQTVIAAVTPPLVTAAFAGAATLVHAAFSRPGRPA